MTSLGADEQIQQLNIFTITHCLSLGFLVYDKCLDWMSYIFFLYFSNPCPGLVPEQEDEGQAAEDDLALRWPGAGCLRPPGGRCHWLLPQPPRPPRPLPPGHWRIPGGGWRLPASILPPRPPPGHAAPGLAPQSPPEAGSEPPGPLLPPAQPPVHAPCPLPAPGLSS